MSNYPFTVTNSKATVYANGRAWYVTRSEPYFERFVELLYNEQGEQALNLIPTYNVGEKIGKHLEYRDGTIWFNGTALHGVLIDLLVKFLQTRGSVPARYIRFVDRLMENVSYRTREQLWAFLQYGNFALAEDGRIVMFKAVNAGYLDKYTRTIDNRPGRIVEMPRALVCDDPNVGCGAGLHAGTYNYIRQYGSAEGDRFIAVLVDPKDVVSVPVDHNFEKVRTARYEVWFEVAKDDLENYRPITQVEEEDDDLSFFDDDVCDDCGYVYDDCHCDDYDDDDIDL